ncbi:hypothetical protein D3C86_1841590 [compost metagenome]
MPKLSALETLPVSIMVSLCSLKAAQASAMPSVIAFWISGGKALRSNVLPAPMFSSAKRAISAFSEGSVGQNCRMKLSTLKKSGEVFSSSALKGAMKSTDGAGAATGWPRKADRGSTL